MFIRLAGSIKHSFVNGPGTRYVVFFQGCKHHCIGCQNPETHEMNAGMLVDADTLFDDIKSTKFLDGVTLSGGDPLFQPESLSYLVKRIKLELNLNVWIYTGFKFEDVSPQIIDTVFPFADVLVDGKFEINKKSESCIWRGSSNQRLIDIPASILAGLPIEIKNY